MKSGFLINKLRLTGDSVVNAEVNFTSGANIITGPSNTGKTFIFQCINYMLGSSKIPKKVKEVRPYSKIYLEITSYQGSSYTLESDLKGGDINLYKTEINKITFSHKYDTLSRKHNPKSDNTISAFLLKLNNIYQKKIRTNAKGKTRQISYRDIIRYILINEERIITEESLIESHYTKATEEKNVLKYIVSGQDDSDIIAAISKTEITNKKGRVELLDELISEAEKDLQGLKNNSSNESIEELEQRIGTIKNTYQEINEEYKSLLTERSDIVTSYGHHNRKKRELEELNKRSTLLKSHYETDIERLRSTIEASVLLKNRSTEPTYCPLCKSRVSHDCNNIDIDKVIDSCKAEINKILGLLHELKYSVYLLNEEVKQINKVLDDLSLKQEKIERELEEEIKIELKNISKYIESLSEKKSQLLIIKSKQDQIREYILQKENIKDVLSSSKVGNEYETLSTANMSTISDQLEIVLKGINYPNLSAVSYSEDKSDFVISGEDRSLFGKGYRAIIYASFIVAIQELLINKDYSIGIPVLDSPLVTYKKPNSDNEDIPIDLAMDFYRYVSSNNYLNQIIVIENEDPPADILDKINHIVFTRSTTHGRYGFIPG